MKTLKYLAALLISWGFITYAAASEEPPRFIDFDELVDILDDMDDDKTVVVNFWATWCAPCVRELPYFQELQASEEYEFIYVSLDFQQNIEKRLVPFIEKNKFMENRVYVLNQKGADAWIREVDEEWSGAIPATMIYRDKITKFVEKSFHSSKELKNFITQ